MIGFKYHLLMNVSNIQIKKYLLKTMKYIFINASLELQLYNDII